MKMRMLIIVLCLLLNGCAGKVGLFDDPVERLPLKVVEPTELQLHDVKFVIVHKDNAEHVFRELEKQGFEPVLFALTGPGYKALALNMQDIIKYMILQKEVIKAYKQYYQPKRFKLRELD